MGNDGNASTDDSITNCYEPNAARARLPVQRAWLYRPEREWTYSHHASITFFKGRFFAIWSNGRVNEDDPGQRVLIASSADGEQWSEPQPLLGPLAGHHSELVLTAAGFHQHAGTLVAYAGAYEYNAEAVRNGVKRGQGHQDTRLWALTSRDGRTWGDMVDMGIAIVPNHGPQRLASGRLLISGNISFPYSDDPAGLAGWTMGGIYPPDMAATIFDDSESFWKVQARQGWPAGLCEGSFYQTDDGAIHMLLRTTGAGHAGKLWLTESRDNAASWSAPVETTFSDNNTKFHFGRLPDGRFYYVGCPDPQPRGRATRWCCRSLPTACASTATTSWPMRITCRRCRVALRAVSTATRIPWCMKATCIRSSLYARKRSRCCALLSCTCELCRSSVNTCMKGMSGQIYRPDIPSRKRSPLPATREGAGGWAEW